MERIIRFQNPDGTIGIRTVNDGVGLEKRIKTGWLQLDDEALIEAFWDANFWGFHDETGDGEIVTIAVCPTDEELIEVANRMRQEKGIKPRKQVKGTVGSKAWERP